MKCKAEKTETMKKFSVFKAGLLCQNSALNLHNDQNFPNLLKATGT